MAVQFRSVSTNTSSGTTSFTVNKPTQTADGDVLVAVIQCAAGSTMTAPSGWVTLKEYDDSGGFKVGLYKKIASSEGASWTWTFGTSSTSTGSVASFYGGHDVLHWAHLDTGTDATQEAWDLDAARDGVGYQVAVWRNATSAATVSASFGHEEFDINATNGSGLFRGMAGYYYGPSELDDIVNAGDAMPSPVMTVSVTPTHGVAINFIIGDKEPDDETWSATNGDFAVELKLDTVAVDTTGSITTTLNGDITGQVSAISSSGDNPPSEVDDNLADGLDSTKWLVFTATGWVKYDFGSGVTKTVRRYRLTSANDTDGRDPMNWTLDGSNDDSNWTTVDTRTGEAFGNRNETREFKLNGTAGAYRYYRLNITSNASSGSLAVIQLAEWRLSDIDVWEDVTPYVNEEAKIRITRGIQSSSGRADFSRAYVELNNTDGRFSLRNSNSPYFGALQRNSQMRISKAYGTKALQLQGDMDVKGTNMIGDGARCPLTSALTATGDMDIRIDLEPKSWRQLQKLCGVCPPNNLTDTTWELWLDDDGFINLQWQDTGALFSTATSTVAIPQTSTRQAIKVTLDADNGASGNDVTFYTSDTIDGSWTQLGDVITSSGTTSIYADLGGALCVGHVGSRGDRGINGLVYGFEFRLTIGGTAVSNIDFTSLSNGAHTWTENSNNWITVNNAVVSNRRYRFHGEVAEWPLYWDPTGTWITASVTGGGVQKRLERGNLTASVMKRFHTKGLSATPGAFNTFATAYAYWPMEDLKDASTLASGLPGKPGMFIYGSPTWDQDDGTKFHESLPLIKLSSSKLGGPVIHMPSGYLDLRWMMYMHTEATAGSDILSLYSTGSLKTFTLSYPSSGNFRLRGYNEDDTGTPFWDTGSKATAITGELAHCQLILNQTGINIDVTFKAYDVYGNSLASWTSTFNTATIGRVHRVNINPSGDLNDTYVGHVAVYGEQTATVGTPAFGGDEMNAYWYETAANRVVRLCNEEGLEVRVIGAMDSSTFVGYQDEDTPFNLMSSCVVADDGYLTDPLETLGILIRTGRSMYNQPASVTLSYSGNYLSGELTPVEDDSYINNDFTASRGEAGSARYQETDGALSVNDPPGGVGSYEDSGTFTFANDGQCTDMASWQVHKGTLDEERYPNINIALENLRIAADTALTEDILLLDIGQRIDITNPPDFLPADDIRQIVIGYEESFDKFQHGFKLTTLPERSFEVAQYDTDYRFAQYGSTLYQDITDSATSVRVVNATGQPWSDTAADFDVFIDGERVTVTSVAYTSTEYSTDTFDRTDSTTNLGSTDGGTVSAWTQKAGTWGINSNTAYISAAATSEATIPGSADFEEVSVTVSTWASGTAGVVFRFTDTSNFWWFGGTVGGEPSLNDVTGGSTTSYSVGGVPSSRNTLVAGDKLRVRAHGSVIECFRNDILVLTLSSTTRSSATLVGMYLTTTAPRLNNFTWLSSDPDQTLTVTRGVNGRSDPHKAGASVKLFQTPYRGI